MHNKTTTTRLIANTLPRRGQDFAPVHRELGSAPLISRKQNTDKSDPFAIKGRTIDQVVDCLLKELSW